MGGEVRKNANFWVRGRVAGGTGSGTPAMEHGSADELNAFIGEVDLSFFVKFSGGHFEGLFAHAEEGVDGFGVGFVVVGEVAFIFLEQADDLGCGVFHAVITGAAGGDVDLCLAGRGLVGGEDIFYKAGEAVADFYIAVDFIEVEDAGMAVVDDDDIADIGTAVDGEVDEVVVFYREVIVAEKGFDLFGGGEAAGLFVEVDFYEVVAAEAHAAELFGFWCKQVFHESPVEEGAWWGYADHGKQDDIAKGAFGLLGSGDKAVFAIVIEEDPEVVAGFGAFGYESFWQQDTFSAVVEDKADGKLS